MPTGDDQFEEGQTNTLSERLEWVMFFRVILVTLLLGSAVVVDLIGTKTDYHRPYVSMLGLIVVTYVATLLYVALIRTGWSKEWLAYLQLSGDVVLVGALVLMTSGVESLFVFLFFLAIFAGAILLGRVGALFAASGASAMFLVIAVIQFVAKSLPVGVLADTLRAHGRVPIYPLVIHVTAFYTVGLLSGYLAEQLGQVGRELERKALDLRELRHLHENILRSMTSGVLTLDRDDRVLFANLAARQILGLDLVPADAVRSSRLDGRLVETLIALRDNWQDSQPDIEITRPNGRKTTVNVTVFPLRDTEMESVGWVVILQDITEVRALQAEVLRQQHLASIGNLAAAIAHEIRNPLAAISGSVEMLSLSEGPDESNAALFKIVGREVDRLNDLVQDFLDYARPRSIQMRPIFIGELVDDTLRLFEQDVSWEGDMGEVSVKRDFDSQLEITADPDGIRQVLWNLLRNAREAVGAKGCVELQVRYDGLESPPLLILSVEDNGPGIAPAARERLFEPFFTTKDTGTGLGLATCHRIVTEHGGTLDASSSRLGGARFVVTLPISPGVAPNLGVQRRRADSHSVLTVGPE